MSLRGKKRKHFLRPSVVESLENRRMMAADLSVSVVSGPAAVGSGDPVSYQIEVTNVGNQPVAADVLHGHVGLRDVVWQREYNFGDVNAGVIEGTIGFSS